MPSNGRPLEEEKKIKENSHSMGQYSYPRLSCHVCWMLDNDTTRNSEQNSQSQIPNLLKSIQWFFRCFKRTDGWMEKILADAPQGCKDV
jgi:hypothetical protein